MKNIFQWFITIFMVLVFAATIVSNVSMAKTYRSENQDFYQNGIMLTNYATKQHWNTYYSCGVHAIVTGVYRNQHGLWYVKDGTTDLTYTGFAKNTEGWWYLESGKVDQTKDDIIYGKANGNVNAEAVEGWWYVRNGKVANIDTIVPHDDAFWYVHNGQVLFSYTGFASDTHGRWRIENGQVNLEYHGVVYDENQWRYYKDGKWQSITSTLAENENGMWYIVNGVVDFTFTGLTSFQDDIWYCENGRVKTDFDGFINDGDNRWRIDGGKINKEYQNVVLDEEEWRYYAEGLWQKNATTVASNEEGMWYISNGIIDKSFTGIAKNQDGYWYCENGKVKTDYNGSYTDDDGLQWDISNGQAWIHYVPNNTPNNWGGGDGSGNSSPLDNRPNDGSYRSYYDGTCSVVVYRNWYADSWCYCAHVQLSDYSRFGSASANGGYYNGTETVSNAGYRLGAILCVNGDYANQAAEPHAAIRRGFVEAYGDKKVYACEAYNANTGLLFNAFEGYCFPGTDTRCSSYTYNEAASQRLITDTFIFGPAGLNNGIVGGSNGGSKRPRTLIGTSGIPGDLWVVVTAGDYNDGVSPGLTGYEGVKLLQDLGCTFGGHLDGGASSAMWFQGELLVSNGRDYIADFVYVG